MRYPEGAVRYSEGGMKYPEGGMRYLSDSKKDSAPLRIVLGVSSSGTTDGEISCASFDVGLSFSTVGAEGFSPVVDGGFASVLLAVSLAVLASSSLALARATPRG